MTRYGFTVHLRSGSNASPRFLPFIAIAACLVFSAGAGATAAFAQGGIDPDQAQEQSQVQSPQPNASQDELFQDRSTAGPADDSSFSQPVQTPEESIAKAALAEIHVTDTGGADIAHGQKIVLGTAGCLPGKPCGCSQCHKIRGEGSESNGIPRLSGQSADYLYQTLEAFASGKRESRTMDPIAAALNDKDMKDVAAYYAEVAAKGPPLSPISAKPDQDLLTKGGALVAIGSAKDGVQGCQNCHGPGGAGLPPVYPYLAGQYANYLQNTLHDFKSGRRSGDPLDVMADIAKRLSDDQIHAVSVYYASIRPPQPLPQPSLADLAKIGAPLGPEPNSGKRGEASSQPQSAQSQSAQSQSAKTREEQQQ